MSACQTPVIVALDFPTREAALRLADQLDPKLCRVKVGKELFTSCAADIVETLRDKGFEVFLDLKFHPHPPRHGGQGGGRDGRVDGQRALLRRAAHDGRVP